MKHNVKPVLSQGPSLQLGDEHDIIYAMCAVSFSLFFSLFLKQETVTECFHDTLVNTKILASVACDYESKAASQIIVRPDCRHGLVQKFFSFSSSLADPHPPPPPDVAIVSFINI